MMLFLLAGFALANVVAGIACYEVKHPRPENDADEIVAQILKEARK